MRNPLLPVVAAFATGIWSAQHLFLSASQEVFWIAVLLCAALVLLRTNYHSHALFCALAGIFICGAFLSAEEHSVLPRQHVQTLASRGWIDLQSPSRVTGWARTPSLAQPGREYLDVQVNGISQPPFTGPAQGVIRFYYYRPRSGPTSLHVPYGARLAIRVRNLRRPRNFMTPGAFDSESYMQRQGIAMTGIIRKPEDVEVLPGREGNRVLAPLYRLRGRLASDLDRLFPEGNTAPILKAMLLGNDDWLSPGVITAFQGGGIYHLLVVSGLNVSLFAFALFLLLKPFRMPQWMQTLLVFLSVVAFTVLAGAGIPIIRATLMISMYLGARLIYRERALLNSIAGAALILLLLHPSDLFDAGFQLSFSAVLIIATVAVPLLEWTISPYRLALPALDQKAPDFRLHPRQVQFRQDVRMLREYCFRGSGGMLHKIARRGLPQVVSGVLAIAEAALGVILIQAGLTILMSIYFHRVAWSGVATNLLVLPLVSAIVPLGFAVLFLSLVWFPAATAVRWAIQIPVCLLEQITHWSARLPRLDRRVAEPTPAVVFAFLLVIVVAAVLAMRRSRLVWVAIAALVPLCIVLSMAPYSPANRTGRLEITALDVGQGDSLFISFPQGHTMLVDGGGVIPIAGSPPPRFDVGEQIVSPFLWSRRIKTVDVLMLTHAHSDHLAGLRNVIQNFTVGELWLGPGPQDPALDGLLEIAAERKVRVVRHSSADRVRIDGVELLFLSPAADWNPKRVSNNDSLVVRLEYGKRHILLAGDAEARMERRMNEDGLPLQSEVLKIGHHGSKTSTTADFLSRVAPRFGIISVGAFSRFGHPHAEVLHALEAAGVQMYRTDRDGSIAISTDGNRIEFRRYRDTILRWPAFEVW